MDLSQVGELAAIGAACCWTVTALCYQEAGSRVGSFPVTFVAVGGVAVLRSRLGELSTAVEETERRPSPSRICLGKAWPNPFNAGCSVTVEVPWGGEGEVEVYDMLGQRVKVLHRGEFAAGGQTLYWDGLGERGVPVASGVYLVRARAGAEQSVVKVAKVE